MGAMRERQLLWQLAEAFASQKEGSDAARLWAAAFEVLPDSTHRVLCLAAKKIGGGIGWEHIDEATRSFEREADSYFDKTSGGNCLDFVHARDLIFDSAERELEVFEEIQKHRREHRRQADPHEEEEPPPHPDDFLDDYGDAGTALTEAMFLIRKPPKRLREKPTLVGLLSGCALCWRTGSRARTNGKFYCAVHPAHKSNQAYKAARDLMWWRPPHPPEDKTTYQSRALRAIHRRVPNGFTVWANSDAALADLVCGRRIDVERFPAWPVNLAEVLEQMPFVRDHLESMPRHGDLSDPAILVALLNPIGTKHRELHALLHKAYLRDQRLLVEMMQLAEAWLETESARRSCWGGDNRMGARKPRVHPRPRRRRKPGQLKSKSGHERQQETDSGAVESSQ